MAKVDPRLYQVPAEFQGNPHTRKYFEDLERFLHDLWFRTGGGDDAISEIINSETYDTSVSSAEYHELYDDNAQIEDLIPLVQTGKSFESDVVTADRIVVDSEFVDMRNGVTVTFDPNAQYNDQIITANGDGSTVKIISAIELRYKGKRDFSMNIRNEGTTLHWYLFISGTEQFWRPG